MSQKTMTTQDKEWFHQWYIWKRNSKCFADIRKRLRTDTAFNTWAMETLSEDEVAGLSS